MRGLKSLIWPADIGTKAPVKTPQHLLCCALAVMLSSTGLARINETLDECVNRYGAAVSGPINESPGKATYVFQKSDYRIMVTFVDGKVAIISFNKPGALSEIEVERLLDANRVNGQPWQHVAGGSETSLWANASKDMATLTPEHGLQITTAQGLKAAREGDDARTREGLEGF
jgi:hypothetical protein